MLSATLREGLSEYGIGEKLRALRLRKKLGLVELGGHTDSVGGPKTESGPHATSAHSMMVLIAPLIATSTPSHRRDGR